MWLTLLGGAAATSALADRRDGTLIVNVDGLPAGEDPVVQITAPGGARIASRSRRVALAGARAGRYVIRLKKLRIARRWRQVRQGATAFPARKRIIAIVRSGRTTRVPAAYGTIVNPRVRKAPAALRRVVGDPKSPRGLIYPERRGLPRRGDLITATPSRLLPFGLVARVQASRRLGRRRHLKVKTVAVSEAVPKFEYNGALALSPSAPAAVATRARARASRNCDGPRDFDMGAQLEEMEVRHASSALWPPQMSFTLAVRPKLRMGPRVAVAGVNCTWTFARLGPWQGAIPTPIGVPIPVYATIPVEANFNVEGSLSAFRINLASTSVLNVEMGSKNSFGFWQEGSNVWTDGVLELSGKASASATLNLELGVGNSRAGNLHVNAGFGPRVSWRSGSGCDVSIALGALSTGVKIGPLSASTPPYSPFTIPVWRGCEGAGREGTPGGAPGSVPDGPPAAGGGGQGTPPPQPPPSTRAEQQGSLGANTFLNPYNASGMGPKIGPYQWVDVSCKVYAPQIQSANPDGYWYRIASAPWSNQYYAVANTFWNGNVPGQKPYTHFTDWAVPNC